MRFQAIYRPRGRAAEYAEWACNLYTGCSHRCHYCYGPRITHQTPDQFGRPKPRENILGKLRHDVELIGRLRNENPGRSDIPRVVHLCFTCDPYQPCERKHLLAASARGILHFAGIGVQVLTKGADLAEADFNHYGPLDSFGCTLTWPSECEDSRQWEPFADPPHARMAALKEAHVCGIRTWVSLEPVIRPEHALALVDMTHDYVNAYRVGPLLFHPDVTAHIDWAEFTRDISALFAVYNYDSELKRNPGNLLFAAGEATS